MPQNKMAEFFFTSFKGKGQERIKNVHLASNPCRLNYKGKELVFSRYNFFE